MAINRNNICEKVLNGTGTPASDFTSPLTPGYSDSLKGSDNLKYNASKAKELWEKANAISPWTSDDKLTFAYNADGGHETIYTAVVNSINNTLGSTTCATRPQPPRPPTRPTSCISRPRKCCSMICRPFRCTMPMPMAWLPPTSPTSR